MLNFAERSISGSTKTVVGCWKSLIGLVAIILISCGKKDYLQFEILKGASHYIYVDSSMFDVDIPSFVLSIFDKEFLVSFAKSFHPSFDSLLRKSSNLTMKTF